MKSLLFICLINVLSALSIDYRVSDFTILEASGPLPIFFTQNGDTSLRVFKLIKIISEQGKLSITLRKK